jgi:hypothetical protein
MSTLSKGRLDPCLSHTFRCSLHRNLALHTNRLQDVLSDASTVVGLDVEECTHHDVVVWWVLLDATVFDYPRHCMWSGLVFSQVRWQHLVSRVPGVCFHRHWDTLWCRACTSWLFGSAFDQVWQMGVNGEWCVSITVVLMYTPGISDFTPFHSCVLPCIFCFMYLASPWICLYFFL